MNTALSQINLFSNMELTDIERNPKRTGFVTDEKFALLFVIIQEDRKIKTNRRPLAWTLSLPIVVIVHLNQEPQALPTIIWDNASAEIERVPGSFVVPDRVCWDLLSSALNAKFASATGGPLTNENLKCLCKFLS